ncbi:MAG: SDR family NAD(P)-dependent oxidoreductase [Nitrosomonadales bacterium]|nr:SDR family NAD(P)-dependent oxidoreductase [Nitrosomonadales bacterium]
MVRDQMKIILVTGATDGIGFATATELARQGHELVLHGRNEEKALRAVEAIRTVAPQAVLHTAHADFSGLSDVARMAQDLSARLPRLDVLINNAGVYMTERTVSQDGYEMTLAVNHLAPFLLTSLLLPLLKKSAAPRVVTVSSMVHASGRIVFDDMNCESGYNGYHAYANSKLANALFANELARRERWLASNSLHPGVIGTKLLHAAFSMPGSATAEGARTSVYLAASPAVEGVTGKYFDNCTETAAAAQALDQQLARQLWVWSEDAVRDFLQLPQSRGNSK